MRSDIQFRTRDNTTLRGRLYTPDTGGQSPCVVMTQGFTAGIEHGLAAFAEDLCQAGFSVLVYDHRGWYRSDGEPRMETNPFLQMQDTRDAITYVGLLPTVDRTRIGLWGSSYAGGIALIVAAVDRRVKCVVSVVPVVSGSEMTKRQVGETDMDAHLATLYAARDAEARGEGVQYRQHTSLSESLDWFREADKEHHWENRVSVLSHDMLQEVEPVAYVHRIAPTPLLMVLADHDTRCSIDLQLEAYSKARDPKDVVIVSGGHFDVYLRKFRQTSDAGRDWFTKHLLKKASDTT